MQLAEKYWYDKAKMLETEDTSREDSLVRELGEEYLGYVTFIMRRPRSSKLSGVYGNGAVCAREILGDIER